MALTLDIAGSAGSRLHEVAVDSIVFRRREVDHDPGSEVAILPSHGPLLMQTQPCIMRFTRAGSTHQMEVGAGVLEVFRDHVTLVET
jgi:F0F1-type ATP synthase epsilon subunit